MPTKFYNYGDERLTMRDLKKRQKVLDFVNPRNEDISQSTIRQSIVSTLKRGILFPGVKPDINRWKPVGSVKRTKRSSVEKTKSVTVAQRIERQPHLKKHLDPKGTLKPKSIISKYYHNRKQNKLPAHEESPAESVFKDASVTRKKGHIIKDIKIFLKPLLLKIIGRFIRMRF